MTLRRIAIAVAAACIASSASNAWAEVLSLHAAWYKATTNEPTWRVAQADANIDQEDSNKARAGLLPQISFSGSNNHNSLNQSGATNSTSSYDSTSSSLSLRQPLFRMQSYSEYQRATARSEGAQFRLGNEAQSLAVRVAQTYFEVLLAEDAIRFSSFLEKSLAIQVDAARKAFRSGSGTRIDIDEARARLAMATSDRIAAESASSNAKKRLSAMVGSPVTELLPLDETKTKSLRLEPTTFAEWLEISRQKSPELAAAAHAVEEASWGINTARAGHLPTLDLVMSRSSAESDTISTINSKYTANAIGVQFNLPIFSGGYTTSDTTQATARYQRALAVRENTERQLETRMLQEYNGILQGEERLTSLAVAQEASLSALRSTRHGVAAGSRTSLDVLNAERQLYSNRMEIARARYDWLMSRLRLQAMAGKLDETSIKEVSGLMSLAAKPEDNEPAPEADTGKSQETRPIARDSIIKTKTTTKRELSTPAVIAPHTGGLETKAAPITSPQPQPTANLKLLEAEPKQPVESTKTEVTDALKPAPLAATTPPTADESPSMLSKVGSFLSGIFSSSEPAAPKAAPIGVESSIVKSVESPAEISSLESEATTNPSPTPNIPAVAIQPIPMQTSAPTAMTPTVQRAPIIPPKNTGPFVIALGSYGNDDNVLRILGSVDKIGVTTYTETIRPGVTRVRAGPFASRKAAKQALAKLTANGIAGVIDKR